MSEDSLIVGFLKVRNELIRTNNLVRCIRNMSDFCDTIFVVDDGSWDGTSEYLKSQLPAENIITVPLKDQAFEDELKWKQTLLELIHANGPWKFIWWQDADEVLDANGTANIRDFCRANLNTSIQAWAFHYTQLWRNSSWARTDSQFDDGNFWKLWRYTPDLSFDIHPGTHHAQFPSQVAGALQLGRVAKSNFEVIHYGNYAKNLDFKCIQYYGGLGGVPRHLNFEEATYRPVDMSIFPSGAEHNELSEVEPVPFTPEYKEKLLKLRDLKNLEKTFCVTISTYNRAHTLGKAIDSVLKQTYQDFIIVVVDDGSTDNTKTLMDKAQELDPRVFYIQLLEHRGGVAVNEIACDVAVNTCEYWTRLGSDDWFESNKLELDAQALQNHDAVMGTFQSYDQSSKRYEEMGNTPFPLDKQKECFEAQGFLGGWADFAVKTSILKKIKDKHGCYVDPRLQNMEDCLQNYRICKISPWVWRGMYKGELVVNPPTPELMKEITTAVLKNTGEVEPTAYWNKDPHGSSANGPVYARDRQLTTQIILSEKDVTYP
jgi:hypothetical protein